jgi:hypothetical protein
MKSTKPSTPQTSDRVATVVFIDAGVKDYQQLADGVIPAAEVFVLDAAADGIEQISRILQQHQDVGAIHIVSHGAPGCLYLGNTQLSLETLDRYATQLQTWNAPTLLLYGCNVAVGDAGKEFLAKLHNLTRANIAASTSKIGHADLGGNWNLDVEIGTVSTSVAFVPTLQTTYAGVFTTKRFVVTDDNESQARNNVPDGDFGKDIRVGPAGPGSALHPIEFDIITDVPVTGTSLLYLSIFDVDRAQGEEDIVSINGTELGLLEGEDDLEYRTLFRINNPSILTNGENFVQIDIDTGGDPQEWEAEIVRAELLVNYQLGSSLGEATLVSTDTDLDNYQPGDPVNFNAEIDTTQPSQNLKIETILRDPNGNAVDFDDRPGSANFTINGTAIDPFTWEPSLPANATPGTWSIDISVFDAGTGDFQVLQTETFTVGDDVVEPPVDPPVDPPTQTSNWDFVRRDFNLDSATDIVAIKKSGTGTGKTEVHIMDRATNYQSWLLQTGTILHETDESWDFVAGDYNRDGATDILSIKQSNTGSGKTEVHIMNAADNYQSWLLQTGTILHETDESWDFVAGDYNRDGATDILGIKKSSTGSGKTEVHIMDGATNYQSWLLQTGTVLHETDESWDFLVGDYNSDGAIDILSVKKSNTGSDSTEIHIMDGATNYQSWLRQTGTVLHETDSNWDFLMDDFTPANTNGIISLKEFNTGTDTTEAHILTGGTNYQNWLLHAGTVLPEVGNSTV